MKKGQKLRGRNGKQVLLFPLDVCNITQLSGAGTFSHCCGHPFDCVGKTAKYPIYAPCDCHLIYSDSEGNTRVYQSDSEVNYASGKTPKIVCFSFTHDENPPSKTSFKQGELIAHTGIAGFATGDHSHIDQAIGSGNTLISYGVVCSGGNTCYALRNSTPPQNMWYINDTQVVNTLGLTFKKYSGGSSGDTINWIVPETSRPLNLTEMQNNAKCFYGYMNITYGMTLNAVCGILGNMQSESTINPNRWQGDTPYPQPVESQGFGLVQWTPWTKMTTWLQDRGIWEKNYIAYGNAECDRIFYEKENNVQWIPTSQYPYSFAEFWGSINTPEVLADMFLKNYERPYDSNQPIRQTQARYWYDYLKNWKPILPGDEYIPDKHKKRGMPLYMYLRQY